MNMGERLKDLRIQKGATQEDIGKLINVSKATIMKYEKGLVENLKRSSIATLAEYFGVTPSYLMCLDEDNFKRNKIEYDTDAIQLLDNYNKLNDLGKNTANIYVESLTKVPEYTETKNEPSNVRAK